MKLSVYYGVTVLRLILIKIIKLMVDDYHEIDVSRILPFWKNGLLGVHMELYEKDPFLEIRAVAKRDQQNGNACKGRVICRGSCSWFGRE